VIARRFAVARRWLAEQWPLMLTLVLSVAASWPLAGRGQGVRTSDAAAHEWPVTWHGDTLRPLAPSAVEQRFAQRFPGHIGRFAAGERVWVLRDVSRPTRALHPASDCFRGLGYRIEQTQLQAEADQRLWRCFVAERGGERLRVCERIVDAEDQGFVDASSWFWAAALGRSTGPWRAMTRVQPL
jgi:hypothetical protein